MFTNEIESDGDQIRSAAADLIAGLMAIFVIVKWLKALVEGTHPAVSDGTAKGSVIEGVAKRIVEEP